MSTHSGVGRAGSIAGGQAGYRAEDGRKPSVSKHVDGTAHPNSIEPFCAILKRAHKGTFYKVSPKHLPR